MTFELVRKRNLDLFETLKPQNEFHCWLVEKAALYSIRVDRAERIERRARDKVTLRAELTWDDDRRLEAELVGKRLPEDPASTIEVLRKTPAGVRVADNPVRHARRRRRPGWGLDR